MPSSKMTIPTPQEGQLGLKRPEGCLIGENQKNATSQSLVNLLPGFLVPIRSRQNEATDDDEGQLAADAPATRLGARGAAR